MLSSTGVFGWGAPKLPYMIHFHGNSFERLSLHIYALQMACFFAHFFFFHLHPHSFHPIIIRRINFFAHPHCNCHAFAIQFCVLLILFTVAGLAIFDSTNSLQCRLTTSGTHENPSKYAIRFNVCSNLLRRSVGCNFCRATCDLMTRQIYIARNVVHCAVQCQQYNTHLLKYAAFEIVAIANLCKQSISPTNEG